MLEDLNLGSGNACAKYERSVVQRVAENQAPIIHQRRDNRRVGGKPHPKYDGCLLPDKVSDELLAFLKSVTVAHLHRRTSSGDLRVEDTAVYIQIETSLLWP